MSKQLRQLEAIRSHKVRPSEMVLLLHLQQAPGFKADLQERTGLADSTLSVAAARTAAKGWVRKSARYDKVSPGKAGAPRTVYLELTKAGFALLEELQ